MECVLTPTSGRDREVCSPALRTGFCFFAGVCLCSFCGPADTPPGRVRLQSQALHFHIPLPALRLAPVPRLPPSPSGSGNGRGQGGFCFLSRLSPSAVTLRNPPEAPRRRRSPEAVLLPGLCGTDYGSAVLATTDGQRRAECPTDAERNTAKRPQNPISRSAFRRTIRTALSGCRSEHALHSSSRRGPAGGRLPGSGGGAGPPAGFVPSFIPIAFCCLGDL